MKVAIVDDERKIREGVFKLIDWPALGLQVTGLYEDGETALDAFEKDLPALVITDIRMPFIDGIELIEECKKRDYKIKFIIISGYDEFSLAQKALRLGAVDYLLKPVRKDELENLLKAAVSNISNERSIESFKNKNLYAELLFNNDIDENKLKFFEDHLGHIQQFMVLVLNNDPFEFSPDYDALIEKDKKNVIVITGESLQECKEKADKIISRLPSNIFIGMSSASARLKNLNKLYYEALEVHLNKDKFPAKTAASYSELQKIPIISYNDIEKSGFKLFAALKSLKKAEVDNAMENIRMLFSNNRVDKYAADFLLSGIFKEGHDLMNAAEADLENEYIIKFRDFRLDENYYIAEVPYRIENYIQFLFETVTRKKSKNNRSEIKRALQYIFDNYNDSELDINKVAEIAGISTGYFSTLFKNETGISFSDYLCNYRINFSMKLLSQKNYRNYEIADMTGFRNSAYFCSVFKKVTGITPGEYRANQVK